MLDKAQVYQLVRNRIWILQYRKSKFNQPVLLTLIGNKELSDEIFFCIIFHENGRLEVPTTVGFVPAEYGSWDFDEKTQEILFISKDGQFQTVASLPESLPYGDKLVAMQIKTPLPNDARIRMFVNDPHLDHFAITKRSVESHQTYFIPRENFEYSLFGKLRWLGFNVKIIDHGEKLLNFFNEIYEYLIRHPQIENIVISSNNTPETIFTAERTLAFRKEHNQAAFDYLSGKRAAILEFLIMVLSENNLRLFNDNVQHDDVTMLQNLLTTKFEDRYKLIDIPNFN